MEAPFPTHPWFPFALSSVTWCPFDLLIFAFPKKKNNFVAFSSPFFFFWLRTSDIIFGVSFLHRGGMAGIATQQVSGVVKSLFTGHPGNL